MSWQMKVVGAYMRLTRKRKYAAPDGGPALLAQPKGPTTPPPRAVRGLAVTERRAPGGHDVTVYDVARPEVVDDPAAPVVVYLHGGAFYAEIVTQHWQLVADLARELDAVVRVPIYGLAPDHHAAEAHDLVADLLAEADRAGRASYLIGDSAGGNLALVGAQRARGRVTGLRGVTVMAPWLDLTMSNPEIDALEPHDPWLARAALHHVAEVWADGTSLTDPTISPLRGTFEALPPVDVWIGTRDISLPDARLLRAAIAEHGPVTYHEEPDALHVHPLLPVPEGRAARPVLIEHVRRQLV
ncbi:alpha/beta hydrolase [Nocardioides panacisoli]|uniref:alpha/beta hydrolase fold domain-containing protein n=1 Tax=Nocardioides panacisoli TaxID=627624 RepID=UPI001C637B0C|nr:alpha/beta hydrolase [Nocardioides panacisoli]QYJ02727.1 alpha/beta hydrolase [Nocardioides panacisoli]